MKMIDEKKKNVRTRIGQIGIAILGVLAVGTIVSTAVLFPGVAHIIAPFIKNKKYSSKQAIDRNLNSLTKSGILEKLKDAHGGFSFRLTKKGEWETLLRHQLIESGNGKKKEWDKIWRIVIFDVPNEKNKIRVKLRRILNMYGFKSIQKSVWVYPHGCDNFITLLKSHLGVSRDVLYLKVLYLENDQRLKKEFCL